MNTENVGKRFSAVIVNYDGGDMLTDCVRSALREGVPTAQIVIVDNGSRDDSLATLEQNIPGTKTIRNPCNTGFAGAVNQGLAAACGDFVLLLNNDAQLQPGVLQAFAEAFDRIPRLAIAGGQLRYPDGRLQNAIAPLPTLAAELLPYIFLKWMAPRRFQMKTAVDVPIPVESVIGACLAVRRAILPELGVMDEDYFFFFEETEWCQRAGRLGFQVYHLPAARALHLQGRTANRFRGDARVEFQRSKLIFFKKSRTLGVYLAVSALLVIKTIVNAFANTILCAITLFSIPRLRIKTRVYWHVLAWHLLGRPASWGLPGKCPQKKDQRDTVE